MNEEEAKAH